MIFAWYSIICLIIGAERNVYVHNRIYRQHKCIIVYSTWNELTKNLTIYLLRAKFAISIKQITKKENVWCTWLNKSALFNEYHFLHIFQQFIFCRITMTKNSNCTQSPTKKYFFKHWSFFLWNFFYFTSKRSKKQFSIKNTLSIFFKFKYLTLWLHFFRVRLSIKFEQNRNRLNYLFSQLFLLPHFLLIHFIHNFCLFQHYFWWIKKLLLNYEAGALGHSQWENEKDGRKAEHDSKHEGITDRRGNGKNCLTSFYWLIAPHEFIRSLNFVERLIGCVCPLGLHFLFSSSRSAPIFLAHTNNQH